MKTQTQIHNGRNNDEQEPKWRFNTPKIQVASSFPLFAYSHPSPREGEPHRRAKMVEVQSALKIQPTTLNLTLNLYKFRIHFFSVPEDSGHCGRHAGALLPNHTSQSCPNHRRHPTHRTQPPYLHLLWAAALALQLRPTMPSRRSHRPRRSGQPGCSG